MRQILRRTEEVRIGSTPVQLGGSLTLPPQAGGIVLFAHGSGSSRFSPRNQFVAGRLQKAGLATLLMDLLTEEEEQEDLYTAAMRFNIPLLTERVLLALDWVRSGVRTRKMRAGCFGSSTGAASALEAAAARPKEILAVVSRGGRPDLAMESLPRVVAPTLLIVGGADDVVIGMNQQAYRKLRCERKMEVIPGATHLFEEPGALEKVADLAAAWFQKHLAVGGSEG